MSNSSNASAWANSSGAWASSWGFVMVRHINNKSTDLYWKESYRCIRKWHPDVPILMIDDSSNRQYLTEDIVLTNCTVIYDHAHKGSAELLMYYYFHLLHPFEVAVAVHDSFFLQSKLDPTLIKDEKARFLWTFQHTWDNDIRDSLVFPVCRVLPHGPELMTLFDRMSDWNGCFGVMSIIKWDYLDYINEAENNLFDRWLSVINKREQRYGLERAFSLLLTFHGGVKRPAVYGDIHQYIRWGVTFNQYLADYGKDLPVMKVWTAR